ncbi:MAG: adenosyl-hopene transferase HpnH [bacterium]|nr:adenosyl-hopene transferase HpnH [bacterium]
MSIPLSQGLRIFSYIMSQKMKGNKHFPLVLMLEPLFRCNLNCAGCGKIQYSKDILDKKLSVKECLDAAAECGAPVVSIPGGEPLLHPEIGEIVAGLIKQKRYIYLCTNALLLKRKLDLFKPSPFLSFSVHLDGLKEDHDKAVCREGVFDQAVQGIQEAIKKGFRVTTNTTLFDWVDPRRIRDFFDFAMNLGIEGMVISPAYPYDKAPDQESFLHRNKSREYFSRVFLDAKKEWKFNQSPFYLKFLKGDVDYVCTPWGAPTRNVFGWQKPCYLLEEGFAPSYAELISSTNWSQYGHANNPKCSDCMVSCGYEPTAVYDSFSSMKKFVQTIKEYNT